MKLQILWMVKWKTKQRCDEQDDDVTVVSHTDYSTNDYYLLAVSENADGFCLTQHHTELLLPDPERDLVKLAPLLHQVINFVSILDPG